MAALRAEEASASRGDVSVERGDVVRAGGVRRGKTNSGSLAPLPEPTGLSLAALRRMDPKLDAFAAQIQREAADDCADRVRREGWLDELPRRVLVTGSSGYLGHALVLSLRACGVEAVGLDLVEGPTTDIVGSVADAATITAAAAGCDAACHCAALHAPNAPTHSEEQFREVNVAGIANILAAAAMSTSTVNRTGDGHTGGSAGGAGGDGAPPDSTRRLRSVVYTSTTSLLVSAAVREAEARGACVWFGPDPPERLDAEGRRVGGLAAHSPRNKYGRTKLEGERVCASFATAAATARELAAAERAADAAEAAFDGDDGGSEVDELETADDGDVGVVVLRTSRFFPEDEFETDALPRRAESTDKRPGGGHWWARAPTARAEQEAREGTVQSTPNFKANELLGRRAAVSDLVDGHLRALRLLHSRTIRYATYILSAPWPLSRADTPAKAKDVAKAIRRRFPRAQAAFEAIGWRLTTAVSRVYDSSPALASPEDGGLGWRPRWGFETLLRHLDEAEGLDREKAVSGRY